LTALIAALLYGMRKSQRHRPGTPTLDWDTVGEILGMTDALPPKVVEPHVAVQPPVQDMPSEPTSAPYGMELLPPRENKNKPIISDEVPSTSSHPVAGVVEISTIPVPPPRSSHGSKRDTVLPV
jgi:hypothetical protein